MATTIQISSDLMQMLKTRKMYDKESYEEVIWDLLEDSMELSDQTKKNLEISMKQIKNGQVVPFEQIKKSIQNV